MLHLLLSIVLFNGIAYYIPKRITRDEMLATSLFALQLQAEVDIYLDVKYQLYGYFQYGVDWAALVPIWGIFPATNIIFLNYYPFFGTVRQKTLYIAGWSLFTTAFEWSAVISGWFYYSGWNIGYSLLCYPLIFYLLARFLDLFRYLKRRSAAR